MPVSKSFRCHFHTPDFPSLYSFSTMEGVLLTIDFAWRPWFHYPGITIAFTVTWDCLIHLWEKTCTIIHTKHPSKSFTELLRQNNIQITSWKHLPTQVRYMLDYSHCSENVVMFKLIDSLPTYQRICKYAKNQQRKTVKASENRIKIIAISKSPEKNFIATPFLLIARGTSIRCPFLQLYHNTVFLKSFMVPTNKDKLLTFYISYAIAYNT